MLPTNLLRIRRRQDKIMPVYAEIDKSNLEMANLLVSLYSEHIGKKKGLLNEAVSELETLGYDYRFVRGLAVILDRRSHLVSKTIVDPLEARRKIFQSASENGNPTSTEEKLKILTQIAKDLKISVEELNESFYGDLDDEMTMENFEPMTPEEMLKQYNLSLTQTLLFNATELSFTASGNWQKIFRQIKWLGLIYSITKGEPDYWIKVDGPTSLFKLTKRYGTSLSKLLPAIFNNKYWRLQAKIVSRLNKNRLFDFEIDSLVYDRYIKHGVEEETFDSGVEEEFANEFKIFAADWKLIREPGPLPVGNHVMIPDFLMKKDGLNIYLEIVGFWTPEYLDNKMWKLSMVKDVDMIVAVDKRLACQKFHKKSESINLIYYKGKIPLKPILTHLQDKERDMIDSEVQFVYDKELNFNTPIVEAKDVTKALGISIEAVKRTITQLQIKGYIRIYDMFVKETLLKTIDETLKSRVKGQNLNFIEASKLIESLGGKNPSMLLEALGYQIMWHGINPESAEIRKKLG